MSMYYWGDPDRAFLQKQSDDYYEEQKYPVCKKCGERIFEDYCYDVDGDIYCEDCFHEKFSVDNDTLEEMIDEMGEQDCDRCERNLGGELDLDPHQVGDYLLCRDCADKWYREETKNLIWDIA